MKILDEFV